MRRNEIAYKEATRDPIFLFQEHVIDINQEADVEWDSDLESLIISGTCIQLDDSDLVDRGWAYINWRTIGVFLTREEAENFGERTHYRYGSGKNIDWRVYCIALERDSELANMLNKVDSEVGSKIEGV